jgi:hypothetical protein
VQPHQFASGGDNGSKVVVFVEVFAVVGIVGDASIIVWIAVEGAVGVHGGVTEFILGGADFSTVGDDGVLAIDGDIF